MKQSKLQWYVNRLSVMGLPEITHRVFSKSKEFCVVSSKKNLENYDVSLINYGKFLLEEKDLQAITIFYNYNNNLKAKIIDKANSVLNHEFSFFNLNKVNTGENIKWNMDYSTMKSCPVNLYNKLNYRDSHIIGDIKYIWELNRFLHFYPLLEAYTITRDNRYADEIISQIYNWINSNPYLMGINWTSALELSIRLISWSFAINTLKLSGYKIPEIVMLELLNSIYQHTHYINNHTSAYSSANNHLIGEAAGLCTSGCLFNFGPISKKWREKGLKILLNELDKQFFNDGMNKEQALAYHCFSLDFYILSFLILEKNGHKISPKAWDKINKIIDVLMTFSDNNLNIPNIGDSDDGYVTGFITDYKENILSLFNSGVILFNSSEYKYKTKEKLDNKNLWYFGAEAISKYNTVKPQKPLEKSKFLMNSGYYIFNHDNIKAYFDIGKLGFLSIAAHGHADALSFCLNVNDTEFLIDPGTYAYHSKKEWRNYFKGTAAHNTIMVDDLNQSEIGGNFLWLKKASIYLEKMISNNNLEYIRAWHDGYIKQKAKVKHQREVLFVKSGYFIIVDRLYTEKKINKYCLNWHLNENCEVQKTSNYYEINQNSHKIKKYIFSTASHKTNIIKGAQNPMYGWVSRSFDIKLPTNTINSFVKSDKNIMFITVIDCKNYIQSAELKNNILRININNKIKNYELNDYLK